jgi:uncharacterized protein YkwD
MSQEELKLISNINEYRKSHQLSSLKRNEVTSQQAKHHSQNMLTHIVPFSHDGINQRLDYIKSHVVGYEMGSENVAFSNPGHFNPIDSWKNSSGHNKNLLGNWNEIGVGCACDSKNHYYTAIFIRTKNN